MAIHLSILAWKIPRIKEPGWLESKALQRIGHSWVTIHLSARKKENRIIEKCAIKATKGRDRVEDKNKNKQGQQIENCNSGC